jgi:hypothetical protein
MIAKKKSLCNSSLLSYAGSPPILYLEIGNQAGFVPIRTSRLNPYPAG